MLSNAKRFLLHVISYLLTDRASCGIVRLLSKQLRGQLVAELTDDFLELLLKGMDLAFCLSRQYRKNIKNFQGQYVFKSEDGQIAVSAVFEGNDLRIDSQALKRSDVELTFKDTISIWNYLLSEDQDILDSLLNNTVEVEGNLNYLHKFGFLARELTYRLGLA